MLRRTLISTLAVLAVSAAIARADDKSDVTAAITKLGDAPSYSFVNTTDAQFVRGPTDGKVEKGGYASLSLATQDTPLQAFMKDNKAVVKTDAGWQTPAEIAAAPADGGGGFNPATFAANSLIGYKTPAEQLKDWSGKLENFKKSGDSYTADLNTDAAKELLTTRGGRGRGNRGGAGAGAAATPPTVTNPKGAVKIWVKDGAVSKFEVHSTGSVNRGGNDVAVDRTNTTEIKDVGSTKVAIPDDAKKKLDAAPAMALPAAPATPAGR